MKATVEILQAVQTVSRVIFKKSGVHKKSSSKSCVSDIGATLLAVVPQTFEESLCSMNIMIVNYCTTAVKIHIDES